MEIFLRQKTSQNDSHRKWYLRINVEGNSKLEFRDKNLIFVSFYQPKPLHCIHLPYFSSFFLIVNTSSAAAALRYGIDTCNQIDFYEWNNYFPQAVKYYYFKNNHKNWETFTLKKTNFFYVISSWSKRDIKLQFFR